MVLCFGTFAKTILNFCKSNVKQIELVPKIAWVIDSRNSSLASKLDFDVDDPDDMEWNKAVVSRLLSCKQPFVRNNKWLPTVDVARDRFKSKVLPLISDDMVAEAVLAVRYIIAIDDTIDDMRKETFKKCLGMYRNELRQKTSFEASDFFARVLLYTTYVNNTEGRFDVDEITDGFIEKATKAVWAEWRWDANTQILELPLEEGGSAEAKRVLDEIRRMEEVRLSAMAREEEFIGTGRAGINEAILFPSRYDSFVIKDAETRRLLLNKLRKYDELIQKFRDCLVLEQESSVGYIAGWPAFPNEQTLVIRQQLAALSKEIEDICSDTFVKAVTSGRGQKEFPPD